MNKSMQFTVTLLACVLWFTPAATSFAASETAPKSGSVTIAPADKTAPAKATPAVKAAPAKAAPAAKATPAKAAPAKKGKKGEESEELIKSKLDIMGKQLVVKAAATVVPNISKKAVTPEDGGYVARYTEIDTSEVVTELIQSTGSGGKYIGSIKYRENHYECRGKTQEEALKASCDRTKARRMNELVRYDGKWMF